MVVFFFLASWTSIVHNRGKSSPCICSQALHSNHIGELLSAHGEHSLWRLYWGRSYPRLFNINAGMKWDFAKGSTFGREGCKQSGFRQSRRRSDGFGVWPSRHTRSWRHKCGFVCEAGTLAMSSLTESKFISSDNSDVSPWTSLRLVQFDFSAKASVLRTQWNLENWENGGKRQWFLVNVWPILVFFQWFLHCMIWKDQKSVFFLGFSRNFSDQLNSWVLNFRFPKSSMGPTRWFTKFLEDPENPLDLYHKVNKFSGCCQPRVRFRPA